MEMGARDRDLVSIRTLCERYALAVDRGDEEAFTSVFTPDGHLVSDYTGNETHFHGREELAQVVVGAKGLAPTTMHFIGNHLAEVDGDKATGVTYCIANHLLPDRSNLAMMIRYEDRYRRDENSEWLIAERRVVVEWTETRKADPPNSF